MNDTINLMVRQMSVSSLVITHEIIFKFSQFKIIYFLMIFNPAYYLALTTQKNGPKKGSIKACLCARSQISIRENNQ